MERKAVVSDKVTSIGYDKKEEILEVEFKNGKIYQYFNVESKLYKKMMKASCIDRYLNLEISSAYAYALVRDS